MEAHPDANIKIACLDPEVTQVAIPMRKGEETATLREAINQALTELSESGQLTELSEKYFGPSPPMSYSSTLPAAIHPERKSSCSKNAVRTSSV